MRPMRLPGSWESAFDLDIPAETLGFSPVIMVCGSKSSDKSMFARCLLNNLCSEFSCEAEAQKAGHDARSVKWIDLNPSQPEFTPPGQLSLVDIRAPVFGPPFTHSNHHRHDTYTVQYAFAAGYLDCAEEPERYINCVKQVIDTFVAEHSLDPVMINLPTWSSFSGLHLLIDTIKQIRNCNLFPSHAFYIGEPCPVQLRDLLSDKLRCLAPPEHGPFSRRTAAELRDMQTMAYFHSKPYPIVGHGKSDARQWNDVPLTDLRPWVVSYGDTEPGIQAVLQMAEIHPSEILSTVLNGRVVSVAYIPAEAAREINHSPDSNANIDSDASIQNDDMDIIRTNGNRHGPPPLSQSLQSNNPATSFTPTILRTKAENIPYVNPNLTASLLAKHGMPRTLGHALVRAIDTHNQTLHLLTPIPADELQRALQDSTAVSLTVLAESFAKNGFRDGAGIDDFQNHANHGRNHSTARSESGPGPGPGPGSGLILILSSNETPQWAYLEKWHHTDYMKNRVKSAKRTRNKRSEHDTKAYRAHDNRLGNDEDDNDDDFFVDDDDDELLFDERALWIKEVDRSGGNSGGGGGHNAGGGSSGDSERVTSAGHGGGKGIREDGAHGAHGAYRGNADDEKIIGGSNVVATGAATRIASVGNSIVSGDGGGGGGGGDGSSISNSNKKKLATMKRRVRRI